MAKVRAKKDCYLGPYGYRHEGEEFEYAGPDNDNLEEIEVGPYDDYGIDELKGELARRRIAVPSNADHTELSQLLVADDKQPGTRAVNAKNSGGIKPRPGKTAVAFDKFMKETSGGFHATDSDWTTVGIDATGFPVEKGSATDVSGTPQAPERRAGSAA